MIYESSGEKTASFIVKNDGRSGGVINVSSFTLGIKNIRGAQGTWLIMEGNEQFIESSREQRITSRVYGNVDVTDPICNHLLEQKFFDAFGKIDKEKMKKKEVAVWHMNITPKMANALSCNFTITNKDFYSEKPKVHGIDVPCEQISWVYACLGYATAALESPPSQSDIPSHPRAESAAPN
jgi:hypothetical protein